MFFLTADTAERLRQQAYRQGGFRNRERALGGGRRNTVLVQCTSATAADGSAVGSQCYPGVLLDPLAGASTQPTAGTVWLTILGDAGAAHVPRQDRIYECILAGEFAVGTVRRPRAFGAESNPDLYTCPTSPHTTGPYIPTPVPVPRRITDPTPVFVDVSPGLYHARGEFTIVWGGYPSQGYAVIGGSLQHGFRYGTPAGASGLSAADNAMLWPHQTSQPSLYTNAVPPSSPAPAQAAGCAGPLDLRAQPGPTVRVGLFYWLVGGSFAYLDYGRLFLMPLGSAL